MRKPDGFQVVLTADRTLMADFRLLFDGILAATQTTTMPAPIVRMVLLPRARSEGVRAKVAPLGLRRIEAALVNGGFSREEVAVVDEDHLSGAIGPATRVVGLSTGEPCGAGMNTTTMTAITGGEGYPAAMFRKLLGAVRQTIAEKGSKARLVVGGPGAWQLAGRETGVDHVVTGYAEGNVADLFRSLIEGDRLPGVIPGENVPASGIPRALGASTMGVVELSRGCGVGCSFCTMAGTPMMHLPEESIVADVETNITAGARHVCAISEDLFRYGAQGLRANPRALIALLSRLRRIDCLGLIQTDHGNVCSISQYTDAELIQVRSLMTGPTGQRYPWVNIGVETASGALLKANGGAPKMGPCAENEWRDMCAEQLRRLCRAGFFPMASIILGLRGETEDDVRRTLDWVKSLLSERLAVFPLLYAPVDGGRPFTAQHLTDLHWRLITTCYKLNFKWIPRMYWDNQRAGGVGLATRCVLHLLGRGQILLWKALFASRSRRSRGAHAHRD